MKTKSYVLIFLFLIILTIYFLWGIIFLNFFLICSIYFSLFVDNVCFQFRRLDVGVRSVSIMKSLSEGQLAPIYVITPTYDRPTQRAELTRLSQALAGEQNLEILEDLEIQTNNILSSSLFILIIDQWQTNINKNTDLSLVNKKKYWLIIFSPCISLKRS